MIKSIRSLLLATLVVASSVCVSARAQELSVRNLASGVGVTAPGSLAMVAGAQFVDQGVNAKSMADLPFDLDGIRVLVGGVPAGIRGAGPDGIVIQVPTRTIKWGNVSAFWLRGWFSIEVETPKGRWVGWLTEQSVSPGIFTNPDGAAQGVARCGNDPAIVTLGKPIENRNTRIQLICTGLLAVREVVVFVGEDAVQGSVDRFGTFTGLDSVSFDLPASAHGDVPVLLFVGGRVSNQITLRVQ